MNTSKNKSKQHARPSVRNTKSSRKPIAPSAAQDSSGESLLVTRRKFLYGAIGAGVVAVGGIGALAYNAATSNSNSEVDYLKVPKSALTTLDNMTALDTADGSVRQVGSYDIPYGTLVWANDDQVAACLLPTESGSPLTQIGLLHLGNGTMETLREEAVSKDEGFEMYDVRANSAGVVWTEANIMQGTWRIYVAPIALGGGSLGASRLVDEGNDTYATPTLAVAGKHAYWQIVPRSADDAKTTSKLMCAPFSSGDSSCVYESSRQSGTPVYGASNSVVITPRIDTAGVYHQLTCIDAESGEVTDTMALPQGMKPLEAGYGKTGFMFSFPDIYDYGDGISNMGTYTPMAEADSNYSSAKWFGFARTPSAPPAWAGNLLIVKSTYSVCGVDFESNTYFAIDVENGAETYGEYLASTGSHETFVTYTNIDHTPIGGEKIHTCRVKIWTPLTAKERSEYEQQRAAEEAQRAAEQERQAAEQAQQAAAQQQADQQQQQQQQADQQQQGGQQQELLA